VSSSGSGGSAFTCSFTWSGCADGKVYAVDCTGGATAGDGGSSGTCTCKVSGVAGKTIDAASIVGTDDAGGISCSAGRALPAVNAGCGWNVL
jgi:hypothetical protein